MPVCFVSIKSPSTLLLHLLADPVQAAVLKGFGQMLEADLLVSCEVRDGPRDFEDLVVGPGREAEI